MLATTFRASTCALVLAVLTCAQPARGNVVMCGGGVPPGVICLTLNVSDTAGGGPLVAGQVYHLSGFINVPVGETLTVEAGAILKFHPGATLEVRGRLVDGGGIYTSLADDSAGGDTNGDGAMSVPAPGDWDGIVFYALADASIVDLASIRYAITGVDLRQADITLSRTTVTQCSRSALDLGGGSYPLVQNCSFAMNEFAVEAVPIEAIPSFSGNTANGNVRGDYMHVPSTTITANLTFGPNNSPSFQPFVFCSVITVPPGLSLNLLPGTVIKFGAGPFPPHFGCGLEGFFVQGTLNADGLTVTSLEDDTVVGDTNKDGGLTTPAPADWGRVEFQAGSSASVLRNTIFRYGGQITSVPFIGTMVSLNADVSFDNVSIQDGPGAGMTLNANAFPTVQNSSFLRNAGVAVERVPLGAVAGFSNNSAADNAGDYLRLLGTGVGVVTGTATILQENSLNGDGLFVVADDIRIDEGGELNLGGGVVFKWTVPDNHSITVDGTLRAGGAAPVVFTSLVDDAVLGDSNKDAGATSPAPGDWTGILFRPGSDASVLDDVMLLYAGQREQTNAALTVSAANPTITDSLVLRSETAALGLGGFSFPTVAGCTFSDNERAVIGVPIAALPGFDGNTATGNTLGNYMLVTNGDVSFGSGAPGPCALTISPPSALAPALVFVLGDDIDVPVGCLLSVLPGTIVKWLGAYELDVDGSVQIGAGGLGSSVAFTSIDDDEIGGDTRNDGFTEGTPGDWGGVNVSADGSVFDDVLVRFAGRFAPSAAFEIVGGSTAQLTGVRVLDSASTALDLNASSLPVVHGCQFDRNVLAVDGVPLRALPGFSANTASDNALGDYLRITNGGVTFDILMQPAQSLNGGPFVVATNVSVLPGVELTLDPGVVFKFEGNRTFDVQGTLLTNSAPGGIVLTTLVDDIAGDTNKDGADTAPGPGAWTGLVFGTDSDASRLAGVRERFAGAFGAPAVRLDSADILVVDCMIERSGGDGLRLSTSSNPRVRRTSFDDGLGIPINFAPITALPGFEDNTASGNEPGDYVRVSSGAFTGPLTVARHNALNSNGVFVMDTSVTVDAGDTLELRQGTVFKWQGALRALTVNGSAIIDGTGLEPVVLTSVADDSVGGDTRKDGAATTPAPGDWDRVAFNPSAVPSSVCHLIVRFAGSGATAVDLDNAQLQVNAIRVDHSGGDGVQADDHDGDATNWVVFQSAGDGVDLRNGAFDLVHATVTGSGGFGVRRAASHIGALRNSISFANPGGDLFGFARGDVFFSDVDPSFDGIDGNISADPRFVDAAGGDLGLQADSPCIDAADRAIAEGVVKDHVEASRILDHDLDGRLGADMGAFELGAYVMTFGGEPRIGTTMSFTVHGAPPGLAIFYLGALGGETFLDPFGFTLFGAPGAGVILGAQPVGDPLFVDVPPGGVGVDVPFGVQALALPGGPPPAPAPGGASVPVVGVRPPVSRDRGSFTNLYRGRVRP